MAIAEGAGGTCAPEVAVAEVAGGTCAPEVAVAEDASATWAAEVAVAEVAGGTCTPEVAVARVAGVLAGAAAPCGTTVTNQERHEDARAEAATHVQLSANHALKRLASLLAPVSCVS
jgi:hypothetical protein